MVDLRGQVDIAFLGDFEDWRFLEYGTINSRTEKEYTEAPTKYSLKFGRHALMSLGGSGDLGSDGV